MTKSFTIAATTAAALGLALAIAPAARADLLAIGYSTDGGQHITHVGESLTGDLTIAAEDFGPFRVKSGATGVPELASPNLNTWVESLKSTGAGTLSVYITQDCITTPLGPFDLQSGFTTNLFGDHVRSVTVSTYIDKTNGLFTHDAAHLASTATFDAPLTGSVHKIAVTPNLLEPYSLTEAYTIVTTAAAGDTSSTIDARDVPEPGSLALLGTALLGMAMTRKRRMPGQGRERKSTFRFRNEQGAPDNGRQRRHASLFFQDKRSFYSLAFASLDLVHNRNRIIWTKSVRKFYT